MKTYEVQSLEQLKALSHKLRVQILSLYDRYEPRTSKQLADELGLPASKVHYHVRELYRVGLLELVETREKGGVIEKYYLPIAEDIRISFHENGEDDTLVRQTGKAFVDEYLDAYQRAKAHYEQLRAAGTLDPNERMLTAMGVFSTTDSERAAMRDELQALLHKWEREYGERRGIEGESSWRVFLTLFPHL